jgi:hypothetical protein
MMSDSNERWGTHDISLTQVSQLKDVFVTHKQLADVLVSIEKRLGSVEVNIANVKSTLGITKWLLGIGIVILSAILGTMTLLLLR